MIKNILNSLSSFDIFFLIFIIFLFIITFKKKSIEKFGNIEIINSQHLPVIYKLQNSLKTILDKDRQDSHIFNELEIKDNGSKKVLSDFINKHYSKIIKKINDDIINDMNEKKMLTKKHLQDTYSSSDSRNQRDFPNIKTMKERELCNHTGPWRKYT